MCVYVCHVASLNNAACIMCRVHANGLYNVTREEKKSKFSSRKRLSFELSSRYRTIVQIPDDLASRLDLVDHRDFRSRRLCVSFAETDPGSCRLQ